MHPMKQRHYHRYGSLFLTQSELASRREERKLQGHDSSRNNTMCPRKKKLVVSPEMTRELTPKIQERTSSAAA